MPIKTFPADGSKISLLREQKQMMNKQLTDKAH